MKVRTQRTHFMGSSNRDQGIAQATNYKTQSVFERSFNKSKSLYSKFPSQATIQNQQQIKNARVNPFNGYHNEFQTQRFDKNNVKPYKHAKMIVPLQKKPLTFAANLNSEIKSIQEEFEGKRINIHKLDQLKSAFVTNNRNRRDLHTYFQRYSKNGIIDEEGLKKIVKQYGYDINEDQAKLIFKLTHTSNKSQNYENHLKMDGFVELMTKESIYYKTLKLNSQNQGSPVEITFSKSFSDKVHQVLRNKFVNLKQAFNIYARRNEDIGKKEYDYVMKKLDLTDLVLTKEERDTIFNKYLDNGKFNVEGLICAIAQQEHNNKRSLAPVSNFAGELEVNKEKQFSNKQKVRNFSLKNLSTLEYETQYLKARAVIDELQKLRKRKKQNNQAADIFKNVINANTLSHQQVVENTQKILKKQGINFHKEDYEAFAAYLNYDSAGNINVERLNEFVFEQPENKARDRFERKVRNEMPQNIKQIRSQIQEGDRETAIKSINKIKQTKMTHQARQLFKFFDKDRDGYITVNQFKQKVRLLNIMENWEVQNLASYLKLDKEGSINYQDFAKRTNEVVAEEQMPIIKTRNSRSSGDWSESKKLKKTFIKQYNEPTFERPTRHSAWPTNLYNQDLSLLQPKRNSGMYISETDRFGDRKQDFGILQKMKSMSIAENKIKKIAEWNKVLQERAQCNKELEQKRLAAKNYAKRLAQQKYEFECHQ